MKRVPLFISVGTISCLVLAALLPHQIHLIWNRTNSAPTGLYLRANASLEVGKWALLSSESDAAKWAYGRGYVGEDWPLIKQVAALEGDVICRKETDILINGTHRGVAEIEDAQARELPSWQGCKTLSGEEIFLLNSHPKSLDGRYFGPTRLEDVDGVAVLVFEIPASSDN